MKRIWKGITAVLLSFAVLATALVLAPKDAFACSCAMPASVAEELGRSDVVFDGTVISGTKPAKWFMQSSADPVMWSFQAHEIWKGQAAPTIKVKSAQSGASCGYEFKEGQRYIVYARGAGDALEVSLCSRTSLQTAASSDIAELGSGTIPPAPTEGTNQLTSGKLIYVVVMAILLLAAVYAGIRIKQNGLKR